MIVDIKDFTWDEKKRLLTAKETWRLSDCPSALNIQGKKDIILFHFDDHIYEGDEFSMDNGASAVYVVDKDNPALAERLNLRVLIPWERD